MRRRSGGCRGWCWCRGRPGWGSRGWGGSSRSTSTGWPGPCGGIGGGACRMGRGWRSGRWARLSGSGWVSRRRIRPAWRRGSWRRGWRSSFPGRVSGSMWGCGWGGCWAWPRRGTAGCRWRGRSCSRGGGCFSSGWRRRGRWCCWWRMPSTPIAACWISLIIWWTGRGTCRCSCWCSPARSWIRPGRGSVPGVTAPG